MLAFAGFAGEGGICGMGGNASGAGLADNPMSRELVKRRLEITRRMARRGDVDGRPGKCGLEKLVTELLG